MQADQTFYSSLVTEYIIPKGNDFAFKSWHTHLVNQAKCAPGFIRADLTPPLRCQDAVVKWYSIIHFDSQVNLDNWVGSIERQKLVESGQEIFRAYRFKSFTSGLEGWFSQQWGGLERSSLGSSTWKQILAVVLGLYPTVMLQSKLFSALGILNSLPPASKMLVNNLITSSILSLVVMPFVSHQLNFWLQPEYLISARKNDAVGLIVVLTLLAIMAILFELF
ncbi:hypothetical protein [Chamaesiphon minutus]|uniref:ABM domain-containing protein n=1 Tax=Chamaesiphon minutus (strain ATCC 27169 / PCC 6605) TaxID=1173020 RepID=K9UB81_CHAP6|nr:hypothetical protein [Chamaesiphon minutus]AFY91878.1 hypothetical protein Cha6605_0599 [Chamaesiphon minutus PCC 6605]